MVSQLPRVLEPEVMDTIEEALDYDLMDHADVNRIFVEDLQRFCADSAIDGKLNSILDLGTGTALIPLQLLSAGFKCRHILACDLSLEMLKLARRHILAANAAERILPTFCDAKRLPVADKSCNIVMSNSIVHHIPQPLNVFREMRRAIKPGGVLFLRDLLRPNTDAEVESLVTTYAGKENPHQRQMLRQSLHAALTVEEVRQLLTESRFNDQWVKVTSDRHWTIAGRC